MKASISSTVFTAAVPLAFALAMSPLAPGALRAQKSAVVEEPSIRKATPSTVSAVVGERPVSVKLYGAGLETLTGAAVVLSGKPVPDVKASLLRSASGSEREVEIAAGMRTPTGKYELVVTAVDAKRREQTFATRVVVAIEKAAPPPEPVPALAAFGLAASVVEGGSPLSAKVTLDRAAHTGGTTVALSSSDPGAASPSRTEVTIPAGQTAATVDVDVAEVTEDRTVTLRAALDGVERTANLTVEPPEPEQPRVIAVHPDGTIFTQTPTTTQGSVDIHVPAPPGGTQISLSTNRSDLVTIPASVTVPEGQTSASFQVSIAPVSLETPGAMADASCGVCVSGLHIVADDGVETVAGSFGANAPDGPVVGDLTLPTQVVGGASFEATVHLNVQPQGPVSLDFYVSGPGSSAVPQLVVPAGQQDPTFTVETTPVTQPTTLEVTARSFDYELTGTTRTVEVVPVVNELASLELQYADFWGDPGPDNRAVIRLTTPSPIDRWVYLESSDPRLTVPDSVRFEAGPTMRRDVPVELASAPTESFPVTVTARAGDTQSSAEATAHALPRVGVVLIEGAQEHTLPGAGEVTASVSLTSMGPEELPVRIEIRAANGLPSERATVVASPVIPAGATEGTFTISVPEGDAAELEIRAVLHSNHIQGGGFLNSHASATLHVGGSE